MDEQLIKEKTVYTVKGKEFEVPKEITHRQYFRIVTLLKEAGINTGDVLDKTDIAAVGDNEAEFDFKTGDIFSKLITTGKVPLFFSTILVPEGETLWKKEYADDHLELMEDIGDVTALEVAQDFLSGRVNLIVGLWSYFDNFLKKNEGLIGKLSALNPVDEQKEKSPVE
jgi:hypothetical protein